MPSRCLTKLLVRRKRADESNVFSTVISEISHVYMYTKLNISWANYFLYTLLFHYYAGNIPCAWTCGRVKFQNKKSRPGWTSIDRGKGSKTHKVRVAGMFDIHVSFKIISA